jgi:hypothetical protein
MHRDHRAWFVIRHRPFGSIRPPVSSAQAQARACLPVCGHSGLPAPPPGGANMPWAWAAILPPLKAATDRATISSPFMATLPATLMGFHDGVDAASAEWMR